MAAMLAKLPRLGQKQVTGTGELCRPFSGDPAAWLVVFLAVAAAWSFGFVPLRASQDEWWHLKAGKWILEHGRLPRYDIFTYAGESLRWHNHEWLAQVLFYSIYRWFDETVVGGLRGLIGFKALVVAATVFVVAWTAARRSGSWRVAGLVALVAADVARRTIYPRPPILSYLFLACYLAILWEWKAGRLRSRWLACLPLATILWANVHGMVPLAVVAVGSFALGEVLEAGAKSWRFRRRMRLGGARTVWRLTRPERKRAWLLAAVTGACAVAAMVNPSGAAIFFLGRKFTADPVLQKVIAEMLPTPPPLMRLARGDGGAVWAWNPLYASFWCSLAGGVVLLAARRGRLPTGADWVLGAFFVYQAVAHVRLLPLYAVSCAPLGAWLWADLTARVAGRGWRSQVGAWLPVLAASLLFWVYVFVVAEPPPQTFFRRNLELLRGKDREPADYPTPVMKFILRVGFPDRMFSEINYCGYMIWWLSPEHHKLFTDNRFDLFGSRFYLEEATVVHGVEAAEARIGRGWSDILDGYGVNFIVISRSAPLNTKLRQSGKWQHVYCWIPPGGGGRSGFNVWLRRDARFAAVSQRALRVFREEYPGAPSPEEFEMMLEAAERRGAISAGAEARNR